MSAIARTDLAGKIEAEHQAAIGAARSAMEHAIRCGQLLLEAKASIGHGGWLPWVEANLSSGTDRRGSTCAPPSTPTKSELRMPI